MSERFVRLFQWERRYLPFADILHQGVLKFKWAFDAQLKSLPPPARPPPPLKLITTPKSRTNGTPTGRKIKEPKHHVDRTPSVARSTSKSTPKPTSKPLTTPKPSATPRPSTSTNSTPRQAHNKPPKIVLKLKNPALSQNGTPRS